MSLIKLQPRASISTGFVILVIVCMAWMLGLMLRARYTFAIQENEKAAAAKMVPKAIPIGMPVELKIHQARAYKQEDWWVLPNPTLVEYHAERADVLRLKTGNREEVFELYYVQSPIADPSYPGLLAQQRTELGVSIPNLIALGDHARVWVRELFQKYPATIYTQWERVIGSERFYAFIHIEVQPEKRVDLGELLVRNGHAFIGGAGVEHIPSMLPNRETYEQNLNKALGSARREKMGLWKFGELKQATVSGQ